MHPQLSQYLNDVREILLDEEVDSVNEKLSDIFELSEEILQYLPQHIITNTRISDFIIERNISL